VEERLIDILEQRELTAQSYMEMATRYNIPLEAFGEKIAIQNIGRLTKADQFKTIRTQIGEFLCDGDSKGLNWEGLYGRIPDKKLRLAICLEILKDKVLSSEKDALYQEEPSLILLDEAWGIIKEQRIADSIYKEWVSSMMRHKTQGPWGKALETQINESITQSLSTKEEFVKNAHNLINVAHTWYETNQETIARRIEKIKEMHRDFDPNSPKWQKILIDRIKKDGTDLQSIIKNIEPTPEDVKPEPCKDPSLIIIGEKHGSTNNSIFLYNILKDAKENGFKVLTLEEPQSTGWAFYIEFAQKLSKSINSKPRSIESKALEFCKERGVPEKSTAQRLTLIHIARTQGYEIKFVDITEDEKRSLSNKRKEKNERAIIDSNPVDLKDPITALGGTKVFSESIIEAYKDCLYRSKEMAKHIVEQLDNGKKIIHVGGLLHSLDIRHDIVKATGKTPVVITIDTRKGDNSITEELGKYPKNNPKKGIFKLDTSSQYDSKLLKSILEGMAFSEAPKSTTKTSDEGLVLN
jgi:hypothetical protein